MLNANSKKLCCLDVFGHFAAANITAYTEVWDTFQSGVVFKISVENTCSTCSMYGMPWRLADPAALALAQW